MVIRGRRPDQQEVLIDIDQDRQDGDGRAPLIATDKKNMLASRNEPG
jgi:hypothetical protein